MSGTNKSVFLARMQVVAVALKKHFNRKSLVLSSVTWKSDALIKRLEEQAALLRASDQAHAAWKHAVKVQVKDAAEVRKLLRNIQTYVSATCGLEGPIFGDFGFTRPPKKTLASKVAAVEKRRATRAARHTLGKKQKLAVRAPAMIEVSVADGPHSVQPPKSGANGAGTQP